MAGLFPTRLTALREGRGWTQADLADRLGVARETVIRWESGRHGVPQRRLKDIYCVFGVTEEEFWNPNYSTELRLPLNERNTAGPFRPGPYLGVPTNEDGLALECPRCGATDYSTKANYCRGCGYPVRNLCTWPKLHERHVNTSEATFCEDCAWPTFWSLEYVTLDEILGRSEIRTPRSEAEEPNKTS